MATNPPTGERMNVKDYFALASTFPNVKYEYHDGVIRLMSGGSLGHARIAGNMHTELQMQFRSGPCTVYNSDARVQVVESVYYFPDVIVSCDVEDRRRDASFVQSPRLAVEVLSPSTEKIDRTEKLRVYQACPTVAEIVLVSQFAPYVEVWRRANEDKMAWNYAHYGAGEMVEFVSLDVYIPIEDIYRNIDFDEIPPGERVR